MGIIKIVQNLKKDRKKFRKGTLAPHKMDNYEDHMFQRTNNFHNKTWKAKEAVASRMRNIKVGAVPFSPRYSTYYKTYKFWIRFVNWKKGAVKGRTTMMDFANDVGIEKPKFQVHR